MRATLESAQSSDQAGLRSGFSCDDHLFTITQIIERLNEHNLPLWICAIDFKKAFDTVEHQAIWHALASQGVPSRYVRILQALYSDQVGKNNASGRE